MQEDAIAAHRSRNSRTAVVSPRAWNKEYLPGYTGFVPSKNELFGMSQGAVSREIAMAGGSAENLLKNMMKNRYQEHADTQDNHHHDTKIFGNRSRFESTWISGPTHELWNQRIPGYRGHYHGQVEAD